VVKAADPTADTSSASIDGFYFNNPQAVGTINGQYIAVTVPYGTDLTKTLIPTIYFTGRGIGQGSEKYPDMDADMVSPASIPASFSSPVLYTVTASNKTATKTYTVTVTVGPEPPKSNVRAITFVSFAEVNDMDLTCVISPTPVPYGSTTYPVEVIVPDLTDLTQLKPVILYKGASISGPGGEFETKTHPTDPEITGVEGTVPVNFTNSQIYTVKAESNQTSQYEVTVRKDENNVKEITGFYFADPVAVGVIDQGGKIITVTVPNGTNLKSLVPTVSYNGVSLTPVSGRAVDFTSPVTYTVTARNNTAQPYTVRVTPKPASAKEITAVSFPGAGVLETIIGANPDSSGYTPISVTVSAQTNIGALHPVITHTGASITPPGGTAQSAKPFSDSPRSFGTPQVYTVTAEDGGVKSYAISVHVSGGGVKIITGFVLGSIPGVSGTVVGQINQDTASIEVRVPHSATDLTGLKPTITYLGKSLGYGTVSGSSSTVDTNTGSVGQTDTFTETTSRDFTNSVYYTVTAWDDSTQEYKVTVTKIPEVSISYGSLRDDKFTEEKFAQGTGLLTVSIITAPTYFPQLAPTYSYTQPFDWYVDGVKYPVSSTQKTLSLKTTDFQPGRHQITVSATRSSDKKHYTNVVYFDVKE
jgi:hypothetical protein